MRVSSRRPDPQEYASREDIASLVALVGGEDVMPVLREQMQWVGELAGSISTDQTDRIHASYRWTIRQVFEHCADAERVFGYRAMRIAAGDTTELAQWDESAYAASRFGLGGTFSKLVEELGVLRQSNYLLLRRIEPRCWDHVGTASGISITVRAIAWSMAGHLQHHMRIVQQRLGMPVA